MLWILCVWRQVNQNQEKHHKNGMACVCISRRHIQTDAFGCFKKINKKKRRFSISLKPIFVCFDSASFYSVFSRIFGMNYFHGKLNIEICFRATSQPFAAMRVNENSTLEKQIRLK